MHFSHYIPKYLFTLSTSYNFAHYLAQLAEGNKINIISARNCISLLDNINLFNFPSNFLVDSSNLITLILLTYYQTNLLMVGVRPLSHDNNVA
jgi:hypothetical protein